MSRILGIVGGIAPPSTVDYYRQLTSRFRALSPDGAYPSLLISSIDATAFFALLTTGNRERLAEALAIEVRRLARAGAEAALFASNTPHLVFDEVQRESPIPLISIVESAATEANARGYRKLGLLGVRFTLEGGFYQRAFADRGMTVTIPEEKDRAYVHDRYFAELAEGRFLAETRAGVSAVIDRMKERDGIEAIVLGGTELPLLFREADPPSLPLLDTTSIHVEAAIAWLLT